jgi:hypothetical protein
MRAETEGSGCNLASEFRSSGAEKGQNPKIIVIPQTEIDGELGADLPVVLCPRADRIRRDVDVEIAETLDVRNGERADRSDVPGAGIIPGRKNGIEICGV